MQIGSNSREMDNFERDFSLQNSVCFPFSILEKQVTSHTTAAGIKHENSKVEKICMETSEIRKAKVTDSESLRENVKMSWKLDSIKWKNLSNQTRKEKRRQVCRSTSFIIYITFQIYLPHSTCRQSSLKLVIQWLAHQLQWQNRRWYCERFQIHQFNNLNWINQTVQREKSEKQIFNN